MSIQQQRDKKIKSQNLQSFNRQISNNQKKRWEIRYHRAEKQALLERNLTSQIEITMQPSGSDANSSSKMSFKLPSSALQHLESLTDMKVLKAAGLPVSRPQPSYSGAYGGRPHAQDLNMTSGSLGNLSLMRQSYSNQNLASLNSGVNNLNSSSLRTGYLAEQGSNHKKSTFNESMMLTSDSKDLNQSQIINKNSKDFNSTQQYSRGELGCGISGKKMNSSIYQSQRGQGYEFLDQENNRIHQKKQEISSIVKNKIFTPRFWDLSNQLGAENGRIFNGANNMDPILGSSRQRGFDFNSSSSSSSKFQTSDQKSRIVEEEGLYSANRGFSSQKKNLKTVKTQENEVNSDTPSDNQPIKEKNEMEIMVENALKKFDDHMNEVFGRSNGEDLDIGAEFDEKTNKMQILITPRNGKGGFNPYDYQQQQQLYQQSKQSKSQQNFAMYLPQKLQKQQQEYNQYKINGPPEDLNNNDNDRSMLSSQLGNTHRSIYQNDYHKSQFLKTSQSTYLVNLQQELKLEEETRSIKAPLREGGYSRDSGNGVRDISSSSSSSRTRNMYKFDHLREEGDHLGGKKEEFNQIEPLGNLEFRSRRADDDQGLTPRNNGQSTPKLDFYSTNISKNSVNLNGGLEKVIENKREEFPSDYYSSNKKSQRLTPLDSVEKTVTKGNQQSEQKSDIDSQLDQIADEVSNNILSSYKAKMNSSANKAKDYSALYKNRGKLFITATKNEDDKSTNLSSFSSFKKQEQEQQKVDKVEVEDQEFEYTIQPKKVINLQPLPNYSTGSTPLSEFSSESQSVSLSEITNLEGVESSKEIGATTFTKRNSNIPPKGPLSTRNIDSQKERGRFSRKEGNLPSLNIQEMDSYASKGTLDYTSNVSLDTPVMRALSNIQNKIDELNGIMESSKSSSKKAPTVDDSIRQEVIDSIPKMDLSCSQEGDMGYMKGRSGLGPLQEVSGAELGGRGARSQRRIFKKEKKVLRDVEDGEDSNKMCKLTMEGHSSERSPSKSKNLNQKFSKKEENSWSKLPNIITASTNQDKRNNSKENIIGQDTALSLQEQLKNSRRMISMRRSRKQLINNEQQLISVITTILLTEVETNRFLKICQSQNYFWC